uniref:Uncharacterized protein n=1 Tax=Chromera velia CCMP2878 TaxID=1169474 RepID=A0A0G4GMW3_9ALVE|eukprot:Cvel_22612.t1-p1 / transcript=Cvel_22612.t1 / gene=Cvel_22612 / organism=Chromera_velia_CCMP2878 / gene_product=hypothetical protein / transcript_product=hypothetical protein / location=Cvel_scaffold2239:20645-24914(+) / protein_length=1151 / sequence_SO=supercontig / SO=protein_coding / is_pseudo=false
MSGFEEGGNNDFLDVDFSDFAGGGDGGDFGSAAPNQQIVAPVQPPPTSHETQAAAVEDSDPFAAFSSAPPPPVTGDVSVGAGAGTAGADGSDPFGDIDWVSGDASVPAPAPFSEEPGDGVFPSTAFPVPTTGPMVEGDGGDEDFLSPYQSPIQNDERGDGHDLLEGFGDDPSVPAASPPADPPSVSLPTEEGAEKGSSIPTQTADSAQAAGNTGDLFFVSAELAVAEDTGGIGPSETATPLAEPGSTQVRENSEGGVAADSLAGSQVRDETGAETGIAGGDFDFGDFSSSAVPQPSASPLSDHKKAGVSPDNEAKEEVVEMGKESELHKDNEEGGGVSTSPPFHTAAAVGENEEGDGSSSPLPAFARAGEEEAKHPPVSASGSPSVQEEGGNDHPVSVELEGGEEINGQADNQEGAGEKGSGEKVEEVEGEGREEDEGELPLPPDDSSPSPSRPIGPTDEEGQEGESSKPEEGEAKEVGEGEDRGSDFASFVTAGGGKSPSASPPPAPAAHERAGAFMSPQADEAESAGGGGEKKEDAGEEPPSPVVGTESVPESEKRVEGESAPAPLAPADDFGFDDDDFGDFVEASAAPAPADPVQENEEKDGVPREVEGGGGGDFDFGDEDDEWGGFTSQPQPPAPQAVAQAPQQAVGPSFSGPLVAREEGAAIAELEQRVSALIASELLDSLSGPSCALKGKPSAALRLRGQGEGKEKGGEEERRELEEEVRTLYQMPKFWESQFPVSDDLDFLLRHGSRPSAIGGAPPGSQGPGLEGGALSGGGGGLRLLVSGGRPLPLPLQGGEAGTGIEEVEIEGVMRKSMEPREWRTVLSACAARLSRDARGGAVPAAAGGMGAAQPAAAAPQRGGAAFPGGPAAASAATAHAGFTGGPSVPPSAAIGGAVGGGGTGAGTPGMPSFPSVSPVYAGDILAAEGGEGPYGGAPQSSGGGMMASFVEEEGEESGEEDEEEGDERATVATAARMASLEGVSLSLEGGAPSAVDGGGMQMPAHGSANAPPKKKKKSRVQKILKALPDFSHFFSSSVKTKGGERGGGGGEESAAAGGATSRSAHPSAAPTPLGSSTPAAHRSLFSFGGSKRKNKEKKEKDKNSERGAQRGDPGGPRQEEGGQFEGGRRQSNGGGMTLVGAGGGDDFFFD